MNEKIYRLHGKVQHYAWGGSDFIPGFLGIEKEDKKTYAEYWMGAHPSASSVLTINGMQQVLHELIQQDPATYLGDEIYKKFGELPYLFKVLDVKEMLSIQVHPTKEEAIKGFEAEEAAGVRIDAPRRNYKDKNHKPEVMIALSEFWLLHGFKPEEQLRKTLQMVPEFNFLLPIFNSEGYYGLYKKVMELPQQKVDEILLPLIKRELSAKSELTKSNAGYWVNKLYKEGKDIKDIKDIDRGIFSIYFFNIVQVQPDEAVFQGAGIPHAYLEGQNIELMANSDNVLRGGLTPKHIDVNELMKHTAFKGIEPDIMKGDRMNDVEKTYPCPVEDFGISIIELQQGKEYMHTSSSAEIYLVADGQIKLLNSNEQYKKGEALYVLPETKIHFVAEGKAAIYKAFVPSLHTI